MQCEGPKRNLQSVQCEQVSVRVMPRSLQLTWIRQKNKHLNSVPDLYRVIFAEVIKAESVPNLNQ